MITDIFKNRIAEERQAEQDEAEKERKKAEELANVMKKAEKDISKLLENASVSAFKIPKGTSPAIIIQRPENEAKGNFTKSYIIKTGYSTFRNENDWELHELGEIGTISLEFTAPTNVVSFSKIFNNEDSFVNDTGSGANVYIIFKSFKAE